MVESFIAACSVSTLRAEEKGLHTNVHGWQKGVDWWKAARMHVICHKKAYAMKDVLNSLWTKLLKFIGLLGTTPRYYLR